MSWATHDRLKSIRRQLRRSIVKEVRGGETISWANVDNWSALTDHEDFRWGLTNYFSTGCGQTEGRLERGRRNWLGLGDTSVERFVDQCSQGWAKPERLEVDGVEWTAPDTGNELAQVHYGGGCVVPAYLSGDPSCYVQHETAERHDSLTAWVLLSTMGDIDANSLHWRSQAILGALSELETQGKSITIRMLYGNPRTPHSPGFTYFDVCKPWVENEIALVTSPAFVRGFVFYVHGLIYGHNHYGHLMAFTRNAAEVLDRWRVYAPSEFRPGTDLFFGPLSRPFDGPDQAKSWARDLIAQSLAQK